ncbi:hypothetical protein Aple_063140 [Acrocarpospora pleiomorpha]|uniref:DDE Tnp4 domain-containing protein n=1 Tax=Acrocarpospora pleiomorpha TaxID=90975 RepID=A0A5M3XQ06_9ACTN|nr:hypothetical protein Aple_063140 [Acrocarpospora pleiomorpha]
MAGAKKAERAVGLAGQGVLTLTDLGYENLSLALRHPIKKPKGGELTIAQEQYNQLIRAVHGVVERANSLLKTTSRHCAG